MGEGKSIELSRGASDQEKDRILLGILEEIKTKGLKQFNRIFLTSEIGLPNTQADKFLRRMLALGKIKKVANYLYDLAE